MDKELFEKIFKEIGAKGDVSNEFYKLNEYYSELNRFYHNWTHIENCLNELESAKHLVKDIKPLQFAIIYHDADKKESVSAKMAFQSALNFKFSFRFGIDVAHYVAVTEHKIIPDKLESKLMIDVDLSILGKQKEVYDIYEKNIRKEYSYVKDDVFNFHRQKILDNFLNRDRIYLTDFFYDKYEKQAMINLKNAIENLN